MLTGSQRNARLYHRRLDAGLCPRCGGEPEDWRRTCAKCLAYQAANRGPRNVDPAVQRSYMAELRRKRLAAGLCARCNRPAIDGLTTCQEHREAQGRHSREYKERRGVLRLVSSGITG